MDTLPYRNMAFLLSLGVLPACPDKDPVDPSDGGTSTTAGPGGTSSDASSGATTDPTTGTVDPTTGAVDPTTGEPTTGSTAGSVTNASAETGLETTGPVVTGGEETTGEETTGEPIPVPEGCTKFAMKYAECYPRYARQVERSAQNCAMYIAEITTVFPECAPLYEEQLACLSMLSCEEFMGEDICVEQAMALEKCLDG